LIVIDRKYLYAHAGDSVLDVARDNGINIPTLCHLDGLSDVGACRLCLVEVKGISRLLPACCTKAAEGMEVVTNSPRLQRHRRMILQMLFAERNHVCSVCVSNGHCELQQLARALGVTHVELPYRYPRLSVDSSHDLFRVDHNRCVLCTRCVRVCDEIEVAHTWDVMGRGIDCRLITDLNQPWGQSTTCTSCGKCVRVCPTGALTRRGTAVGEMQKDVGFLGYLASMRDGRDGERDGR
jgi:bidirectional [NiFe] hydrogenase diaphorase subunit